MLQVERFKKEYSDRLILNVENLHFEEGIHWVKGGNGSGKSTFFKCVAGISPYKGTIVCDGISLSKAPVEYKMQVNYAQAEPVFPSSLSGRHVLEYFAALKKASKEQFGYLVEKFGMESFLNQSVKSYSSGMTKKLALSLAFLGHPKLILLDEPFNALDAISRDSLFELMETERQKGCSFLLSTHHDFGSELNLKTKNWLVKDQTIIEE